MDEQTITLADAATEEDVIQRIEDWLLSWAVKTLKIDRARVDRDTILAELGLDSVDAVYMISDLEAMLSVKISTGVLLECPTARLLATHVAGLRVSGAGGES